MSLSSENSSASVTRLSATSASPSSDDSSSLLQVEHLSWAVPTQNGRSEKHVLDDLSFSVKPGKFVGLIGPNGAGKSSLMRCIYRVTKPTAGSVHINGRNVWELSGKQAARTTAVILQEQNDYMGLTVYDVVAQGLTPHKGLFEWDNAEDKTMIASLLSEMELDSLAQQPFSNLSGGEKQRAFLARALLQSPQLLMMDEPTNHLDIHFQLEVLRKVKSLPITVFASFHDLNLAAAFCDELIVLEGGRLCAQGTPEQVLTEDLISKVYRNCCIVDQHPIDAHPRVSFAYHKSTEGV